MVTNADPAHFMGHTPPSYAARLLHQHVDRWPACLQSTYTPTSVSTATPHTLDILLKPSIQKIIIPQNSKHGTMATF